MQIKLIQQDNPKLKIKKMVIQTILRSTNKIETQF